MGIFEKRIAFKPFEYPDVVEYKNAINHSYWLVSEWNFISDLHDFNVKLNDVEKNAIKNTLLAISQIEVSVKKFWTKLGDRFPKPEFEQVGVTFGECHIDGTEILTPNGWVDLKDIKIDDDVIQYNKDSTLNVTKVLKKVDQEYSGQMIKFYKRTTETVVTPDHRMVYFNHKDEFKESLAKDFNIKNSNNKIPESGKIVGTIDNLSFVDRLKIAIQADGNRRYYNSGYGTKTRKGKGLGAEYEIRIKKQRKKDRLEWILSNVENINFSKKDIPSRPGMTSYTIGIDDEFDYKTFDWVNLNGKSYKWCREFVDELTRWDGTRVKSLRFSSTVKDVADKAQMVGIGAGYRCNLFESPDKRGYLTSYIVSFIDGKDKVTLPPLKSKNIDYTGMVRCVTVESGVIITRYKGKMFIGGNSEVRHADAYSHLLQVLNLNDDFSLLLQNPVIQGRVDYLTKYLKGASDNSDENYTLTLTLFSIFIENVSLFSQFVIIKAFNKYLNVLKDIDNVVQATQKEELIHALLGVYLIKKIQEEKPEWFNAGFYQKIYRASKKAFEAEKQIIDWIFEKGELSFLPKDVVVEFTKHRFNESIEMIGGEKVFDIDHDKLNVLKWFNDEIYAEVSTDFFHKKSVKYSKFSKSITSADLF